MAKRRTSPRIVRFGPDFSAPGEAFVLSVPGTEVPLVPFDLPKRLAGAAREAVAARQITDATGLKPGSFELRPLAGPRAKQPWCRAALADAGQLARWREAADSARQCAAILPDYLALPAHPDLWVIEGHDGTVHVRVGTSDAFSAETDLARHLLKDQPLPRAILVSGDIGTLSECLADTGAPVFGDLATLGAAGFAAPERFAHDELDFDLARNAAAERAAIARTLRAWALPAVAALLALAVWSGAMMVERRALAAESVAVRAASVDIARRTLIPSGPIPDMRAQITRALARIETRAASGTRAVPPLALFRDAAEVIAAAGAGVTLVEALAQPGKPLALRINTADFARLDGLVAALKDAGIATTVTASGVAETGGVDAALSLEAAERAT